MTTGVILLFLGVIPNTPHAALIIGGGGLVGGGYLVKRGMERQKTIAAAAESAVSQTEEVPPSESDYYKDINNVYSLLTVEPIEIIRPVLFRSHRHFHHRHLDSGTYFPA